MESNNQHVCNFLTYYCSLTSPEYAILIKGLWGTGKTWFIKNWFKELNKNEQEYIYISLYGITSIEDIENEFFRQLHPFLASKSMKLLGKLAKNLIGITTKINLDGQFDSLNKEIVDSMNSAKGKVLVFDDLERCSMPVCDILGYINKFVEHSGFKVIIIANENEIIEREENDKSKLHSYMRIKEKLVGKTFEISPEISEALGRFIDLLLCDTAKTAIIDNQSHIIQLYECSEYKNLRVLRHALSEFDRFFAKLPNDISDNKEFVSHFLAVFLIYSFEIMSGTIQSSDISNFNSSFKHSIFKTEDKDNPYQKYLDIRKKYNANDLNDTLFPDILWQDWFNKGFIASEDIVMTIKKSRYFKNESMPNWEKLWYGKDLSDSDFNEVFNTVLKEWEEMTYNEVGVIKHVACILFWLSDINLYSESKDQILKFSKGYIDHLKKEKKLPQQDSRTVNIFDAESWGGLGFYAKDEEKFKELIKYISDKMDEAVLESYESEARTLLYVMKEDTDKFFRAMIFCGHEDNKFYDIPILTYITPGDFVRVLLELTPEKRRTVSYIFEERYKFSNFNSKLTTEIDYLKEVKDLLEKEKEKRRGKISEYSIGLIVNQYLNKAIARLEESKLGLNFNEYTN
ncbi:KAP family NTPase [Myxococcota bacterium]|nr:KAP family NTPase [Myxococcota bacterium]MBU1382876.1 KAP family NTPase [Myxococcota bacterium]MBU1496682.1 KAP family NTPase [Myxococcota bacterium]